MTQPFRKVIVVGAGPVGLLLAFMLAKRNIEVVVLEADKTLNKQPRGIAYGPPAVAVLKRAGLLDEIHERGTVYESLSWRKVTGEVIATLERHGDEEEIFALPVPEFAQFLLDKVEACPTASVLFNHRVSDVGTTDCQGWVNIDIGDNDDRKIFADFVLGCDGGRSGVRKALFGNDFPGFTWEMGIIAADIIYDIERYGWSDANWIIDPNHWGILAKISPKAHRWRVGYGEETGLTRDEVMNRLPQKLKTILPGHPEFHEVQLLRFSPFVMNQRCVKKMRVDRVLLAGDAAHLCNTMGGLGLTSGIADAGSLVDCLYGILDGKADLDILDHYDEDRRRVYETQTSPISTVNLERMMKDVDSVVANDPFIANIAAKNEDFLRMMYDEDLKMSSDMTKYFKV